MKFIDDTTDYGMWFKMLICADGIKYSLFKENVTNYEAALSKKAGVYHFYSVSAVSACSLYIGKAGFGSGKWNLYERLKQHQQPSQGNTVHGAISVEFCINSEQSINLLSQGQVYLQYVAIHETSENNPPPDNIEQMVTEFESYCISRLNPKYSKR